MAIKQGTWRYLIYNIQHGLKSVYPDSDIQEPQIYYWIATVANLYRKRHLQGTETGAYLTKFTDCPVLFDGKNQYVTFPAAIYDLINEKGIGWVTYSRQTTTPHLFTQVFFQFIKSAEAFRLYYSPYEKPTPANPYAYRTNNNLYLLGVETITLKTVDMALFAAIDPRYTFADYDAPSGLNPEQEWDIEKEVLNLGRWVLTVPDYRIESGNDGRLPSPSQALKPTGTSEQPETQENG